MVTCPKKTRHFAGHKFTLLFEEGPVQTRPQMSIVQRGWAGGCAYVDVSNGGEFI